MDDIDWGSAVDEELTNAAGFHEQTWSDPTTTKWCNGFSSTAIDEIDTFAGGDGLNVPHTTWKGRMHEEQGSQTEDWTTEREVNTEPNWESLMQAVEDCSSDLARHYEELQKEYKEAEVEHGSQVHALKQTNEESKRQHQAVLEKIESVHVKLQLNCRKTTRKNFAVKKQELNAERSKMEEEKSRLTQELEETNKKLSLLTEEQSEEKQTWARELSELNAEMGRLQREAEEAGLSALRDEMAALEVYNDVTLSQVNDWLMEAKQYIDTIRMDPSKQKERQRWEQIQAEVHGGFADLKNQFKKQLQLLQSGHKLESLPTVNLPDLPHIPTVKLVISQIVLSSRPPMQHFQMGPPMGKPFAPQHLPSFPAPARVTPPLAPSPSHSPLPMAPPSGASLPAVPPSSQPPAQPPSPSNPPPVGKLDKLLEKLGARFPNCTRAQLMSVLQHIKVSRGTMAGMSMEEVTQQVALRLEQNERALQGPTGPPFAARGFPGPPTPIQRPPGTIQRPMAPQQRPAVAQVFNTRPPQPVSQGSRKLCLMCQNQVEAVNQHIMSCNHIVHKECISVWLQSSKNNSCPFCPAK
ncbi:RING finger protein 214 [Hypomesus transpacificus]|uniref:RING finger protein 214 n=1 Tax=Hypomesus transpacificus TaxID=137520 RepID=UPI001F079FAA|nr:RING finger protein 214 [Hypomesus transpacificus]XP_046906376.1 RING finger protein 214 [Hypomesus transpacificus]XP_046906377.1 RING finger protein 214 [Hypomesus transpacificus]